ncbi:MAG TPA: 3-ketoacyl-ACP reductase [Chryseolinea sp.]|nr:3-ketoacyl-ACP reductase [Chryseolinea sp.]
MNGTALITGGSRGIGFAVATALAKAGYNVAINGVREEADVKPQLKTLLELNVDAIYCQGNIGEAEGRSAILEKVLAHFGSVELLVNNAGVAPAVRHDILDLDESNYDRLLDINLKGTFFLTQQVARHMIAGRKTDQSKRLCIITISSISATVASVNRAEYCISKAGLGMLTKLFATRLAAHEIPVYEIRPGIIKTDMTSAVTEKYDKLIQEGLTLEGRWGTPEDIGKIVLTLATGQIPYATGQVIEAAGGMGIMRL